MDLAEHSCFIPIEDTTNRTESQQIKSSVGFWREAKTGVPGKKPLRVENQQTQFTYNCGLGIRTRDILAEGDCSHRCFFSKKAKTVED